LKRAAVSKNLIPEWEVATLSGTGLVDAALATSFQQRTTAMTAFANTQALPHPHYMKINESLHCHVLGCGYSRKFGFFHPHVAMTGFAAITGALAFEGEAGGGHP
jgi:hypothetical protein